MSESPASQKMLRYAPLLVSSLVLIWHSLQYNFVTDDAYISFVFSENLAEHGQLVFNPGGTPVEGYTNFLWTFLLGLLMMVGLPPEVMSLVLGTAFALGSMAVALKLLLYLNRDQGPWNHLASGLLALSSGFACWSSGGLETQMFSFFVTLALYSYVRADETPRYFRWLGVALALAAMTRPEGLLITAIIGGHRLLLNVIRERRLKPQREELLCMGLFLVIWAPWFIWRSWYYGHLFPNTYYVKAAGKASAGYAEKMHANGRYYVGQWLLQSRVIYAAPLIVVGLLAAKIRSARFVYGTVAALVMVVYLVYTMRVGGDFMGLHRFVMPLFIIAAVATSLGLKTVIGWIGNPRFVGAGATIVILGVFGYSQYQLTLKSVAWGNWKSDHGIDTPAYLATYAHDRKLIGEKMRPCFRDDDFSIFGGVGAKPFHAKTKGIDVFGLVSEVVAHKVPRTRARAGHNKWAPDRLLLDTYDPDFVFHCYSLHSDPKKPVINCCPRNDPGCESGRSFWQRNGYKRVTMHIPGLLERGEYYTFFVDGERVASFKEQCEGVVE